MSKGRQKNKYQPIKEEWIQMEDMRAPENKDITQKIVVQESSQYLDHAERSNDQKISKNNNINNNLKQNKYINPDSFQQQAIHAMNVNQQTNDRKIKKPTIPLMQVVCQFCTVSQTLPGNAQVYICGSCQNMNQCFPLYGIFICGCCKAKVCYGFGTSQYIKCLKCSSINRVPTEPTKKYIGNGSKAQLNREVNKKVINKALQDQLLNNQRECDNEMRYKQFNQDELQYPEIPENNLMNEQTEHKYKDHDV